MSDEFSVRHSKADEAVLVEGADAVARQEAANALVQAERVRQMVMDVLDGRPFRLRPSAILELNRCAVQGLTAYAGTTRPGAVQIGESRHQPPEAGIVHSLLEEMCDYVNENWRTRCAVHLSSFVMWRLNWIHPFTDGNGRTSRAASYLVLCAHSESWLPGRETIPEQIQRNRVPYYEALEAADARFAESGTFSADLLPEMEDLLGNMLARQLATAFEAATR
ncbi:Fic family protein [Rhodobacter sp. NSM]|uniref:Fic family protein n=1 Tax=Rhodobacter sp. NSM TaxID=3457501 RepID=UPI003FD0C86F